MGGGDVIVSRGPVTSIALAPALVQRLAGAQKRREMEAGVVLAA
ncbi:MAG: hypothetical protein AB1830_09860 [Pseudomonadota bacterium]